MHGCRCHSADMASPENEAETEYIVEEDENQPEVVIMMCILNQV